MSIKRTGNSSYPLRKGREFQALAMELQRESGLTMAAFCRRERLRDKAFWRWKRKLSLPPERTAAPAGICAGAWHVVARNRASEWAKHQ